MRPRVTVYIATSLDQYIARPDGSLDWLESVQVEGEDYGYAAFMAAVDCLVMGRSTWNVVAGFEPWPYAGKRLVVLTHRPLEASHAEETHAGPLGPLLDRLGASGVRHVYLDGGQTITAGLREGVVDEMILSVLPCLLGAGIPLFGDGMPQTGWTLVETRGYPSGLVQTRYARG